MALVLDAGALIGIERGDRTILAFVDEAQRAGIPVRTTTSAVAQVWRDGAQQVRLVRVLRGIDERGLDQAAARRVGRLLGASGTTDVVDGSIVDCAVNGDDVLTSDPEDISVLGNAARLRLSIVPLST